VHVDSRLPLIGPVPAQAPHVPFEDTFSVRAGLESVANEGVVFRGGYGFEQSPVPANQTGVTNLLDGNKHTVGLGAGYLWKRLRVDAHVQFQIVTTRQLKKTAYDNMGTYDPYTSVRDENPNASGIQSSNPGYPSLKSGGEVLSAGITLEVPL
jgi:long-subunit fatty acid transport protein